MRRGVWEWCRNGVKRVKMVQMVWKWGRLDVKHWFRWCLSTGEFNVVFSWINWRGKMNFLKFCQKK